MILVGVSKGIHAESCQDNPSGLSLETTGMLPILAGIMLSNIFCCRQLQRSFVELEMHDPIAIIWSYNEIQVDSFNRFRNFRSELANKSKTNTKINKHEEKS